MLPLLLFLAVSVAAQPWKPDPSKAGGELPFRTVNGTAFTRAGNELYTSDWVDDRDPSGRRRLRIVVQRRTAAGWSTPEPVPFRSEFTDYQPVLSLDGKTLFFNSTRPLPSENQEGLQNLWFVKRTRSGWSQPQPVPGVNTPHREGYAAPVKSGDLYFNSDRPGGLGAQDIYVARKLRGGGYGPPELVRELSSADSENDLWMDPAERFVILNRFFDSSREISLFFSRRINGRWQTPVPLDSYNRPKVWELTPCLSPDGKFLLLSINSVISSRPWQPPATSP